MTTITDTIQSRSASIQFNRLPLFLVSVVPLAIGWLLGLLVSLLAVIVAAFVAGYEAGRKALQ